MPLYEFQCEACDTRFERIQKYTDPLPETCPKCGKGPVKKLFSSPAIQFKGSGFYITDYAKKSSPESSAKSSSGGDSSSSSSSSSSSTGGSGSDSGAKKGDGTSSSSSASPSTNASGSTGKKD